jgi:hypothetical protein
MGIGASSARHRGGGSASGCAWSTAAAAGGSFLLVADVGWVSRIRHPQIEVDNAPQDAAAKHDRQLERALATALQLAKKSRVLKPKVGPRPNLARKSLPARS